MIWLRLTGLAVLLAGASLLMLAGLDALAR